MALKILLILENDISPFGGIERHCYNLLDLFKDEKISYEFITLTKSDLKYNYISGINKIVFNKNDLRDKILESKADIVHIHGFASFVVVQAINCAFKLNKKIVYTAHYHPFDTLDNPFLGKLFFKLLLAPALKKVDAIIAINKDDFNFFNNYSSNVNMIPHWLNQKTAYLNNDIKRDSSIILFVGRSDPNKGIDHLYNLPINKYKVHCVSNGTILRSDFIQHKNISDDELFRLYQIAGVLVVPSRYEAFSYATLEALSTGCPAVLSDRVRIGDYLQTFIGSGVEVFKYGDYNGFKTSIEKCIKESVNIESVNSIFDSEFIKQKYEEIYLNLL